MAFRLLSRKSAIAPGVLAVGIALYPATFHAEAPESTQLRKPIYDDFETAPPAAHADTPAPVHRETTRSTSPTPTDRLAVQIGKTRLFIHAHVAAAETKVNELMDNLFHLESSFTGTVASLAPSRASGERLMPGSIYVLVAAMTGSIMSRNRNILIRAAFPLAVGIGAGWAVLPVTMTNVGDLLWTYEKRFPAIAEGHIRTRQSIEKAWEMARVHSQQAVNIVDAKVGGSREAVEGWVRKGK